MRNHNNSPLRYGKLSPSQEKTLNGARGGRGEQPFRHAGWGGGEDHRGWRQGEGGEHIGRVVGARGPYEHGQG